MNKFLKKKLLSRAIIGSILAIAVVGGFLIYNTRAAATITPATGGGAVSIDTTTASGGSGTWTNITGMTISEGAAADVATGVHYLTLPVGWEFDTSQMLVLATDGKGLTLSSLNVYPSTSTIAFTVNVASLESDSIYFPSIKVRPTGTATSTGNITHSGAAIVNVVDGSTNFGTLTTIPGVVTKVAFTTQPTNTIYGSAISNVVVKTQDQFSNISTNSLGASVNVTMSTSTGPGTLSGTTVKDIGTGSGNGVLTFNDLELSNVGTYVLETQSALTDATSTSFEITQKTITATITASNKTYDASTTATITGRTPVGVEDGDTVTLSDGTANFVDKNIGTGKTVNATGLTKGGADEAKYSFDGNASGTANITALELTVGGTFSAANKVYDGNLSAASSSNSLTLVTVAGSDDVSLTPTFAFATSTVGTGIEVGLTASSTLNGVDSGNYSLSLTGSPTSTADITTKELTITGTFTPSVKTYDATTTATLASNNIGLSGIVDGDTVSFTWGAMNFDNKNVGTDKTVTLYVVLTGDSSGNYSLPSGGAITSTVGQINAKSLTVGGSMGANNKAYDGNSAATNNGSSFSLSGVIGEEVVGFTPVLAFSDKMAGNGKTVSLTASSTLFSDDSINYSLSLVGSPTTTANITKIAITLTATSTTKVYDATTTSIVLPTLTSGSLITGDTGVYSQSYDSKAVGTGKTLTPAVVSILDGDSTDMSENYTVTLENDTNGVITNKELTVTDATVTTKVYDGNTSAEITGAVLSGVVEGDAVILGNHTTGTFNNKNVGANKTVTTTPMTISGDDSSNYTLTQPTLSGDITVRSINVTAQTDTKVYDDTTNSSVLPVVDALQGGDTITATGTQVFSNKNVGSNKTLIPSGTVINDGNGGSNYSITYVNNTTGVIRHGSTAYFTVVSSTTTPDTNTVLDITVTAKDSYGNTVDGANGASAFTGIVVLSTNATTPTWYNQVGNIISGGVKNFTDSIKFTTAENGIIITAENSGATITGTSSPISISSASDTTAPTVTVEATSTSQTTADITFSSNEAGTAKIGYGLTASHGNMTSYSAMSIGTSTISLSGLTCATTYHYSVYGKDSSNNEANTADATFTTSACSVTPIVAIVAPVASAILSGTSTLTFTTNSGATTAAYVSIDGGTYAAATTNANPGTYTLGTTGLANGSHTLRVKDTVDGVTGYSDYITFFVSNNDTTAPIFDSQAPTVGSTSVSITPEDLYVAFSEALDPTTVGSNNVKLCLVSDSDCSNPVSVGSPMLMENGTMIRIGGPSVTLSYNTAYWINITTGITDLAGNHLATAYGSTSTSNFTTVVAPTGSLTTDTPVRIILTNDGTANNNYANGWEWKMRVTLPTNESLLSLKFADWVSGSNTLAAGGNMQYYSEQIASGTGSITSPIDIATASTYPSNIQILTDADTSRDGIQTDIHIKVKIPATTAAGSYSTSYGVRSQSAD